MKEEQAHQIISGIYDALLDPGAWRAVLDKVASACNSLGGSLYYADYQLGCFDVVCSTDPDHQLLSDQKYSDWYKHDIWQQLSHQNAFGKEVLAGSELISRKAFRNTVIYNDYYLPTGLDVDDALAGLKWNNGQLVSMMTLYGESEGEGFNKADLRTLAIFHPHIQKSLQIRQHFQLPRLSRRAVDEVLGAGCKNLVVLGAKRELLYLDAVTERSIQDIRGVQIKSGYLCFLNEGMNSRLDGLFKDGRSCTASAFTIGLESHSRCKIRMLALPFPHHELDTAGTPLAKAEVLLVISEADPMLQFRVKLFSASNGLSNTEQRLLQWLAEGRPLKDYSVQYGVSVGTARTQLKNICGKAGVSGQVQLLSTLFKTGL